ncbi:hypothetical protein GCM10025874_06670 [Arenivirga flava]|uniref:NADP-dependent oxidoreductase domain-containing protein n=1 Tax=Arenivirga flava TaxID=1930060 RepID=A0AA37UB02_9MICO|nr:hypothetical protein GCM10025874_06670 [Arenivirga flava]
MTTTSVKTRLLPGTDITAPNIVLGLMRIADKSDDEIRALVRTANDHGIDFIDHADIYGGELHRSERRWAEATQLSPAERDAVTIQTKAGIRHPGPFFDFSFEHLVRSAEASSPRCRPTASTCSCCTAPTRSSSPTRSPGPSITCTRAARCATSASATTRRGRSTC